MVDASKVKPPSKSLTEHGKIAIGFAIGLGLLVWWLVKPNPAAYGDAIRAVISQDKIVAARAKKEISIWEMFTTVKPERLDEIVKSQKAIDTSRCPPDFQKAYADHIKGWEQMARAYRGQGTSDSAQAYIEATWLELHRISIQYGISDWAH